MKTLKTLIVAALLIGITTNSVADVKCNVNNLSFKSGEEVTYILSYTWFLIWTDVGEVTFKVNQTEIDGQPALHLHTFGFTYTFYDWFYKVRDIHESWVEPSTLKPIYFNRDVNQGNYTKENEYWFDWESNIIDARIQRRGRENAFYEIPLETCTYDVVSAIYLARNLDFSNLKPNQSFPINVALDEEVFNVTYRFIEREKMRVKGVGRFNTLKFAVELVAGDVFSENQKLYVWVTDDENRIPVYIESPIKVGKVRVRIASWEGLKHSLTSKIN